MFAGLLDQLVQYTDWLVLLAAKATVLLTLALLGTRLLRRQSARVRHALWSVTFVALALLPIMEGVLPPVEIPGVTWPGMLASAVQATEPSARIRGGSLATIEPTDGRAASAEGPESAAVPSEGTRGSAYGVGSAGERAEAAAPAWRMRLGRAGAWALATLVRPAAAAAGAIWLLGVGGMFLLLGLALVRARRIAWRAPIVRHHGWRRDCETWCRRLGLRRVVSLRVTDEVTTPMAGGVLAPFVLLPLAALEWPASRREVVLQHELLHLRGLDPLRALAARCAAAIYWFHPLVWIAGREAVLARESACDEQVVALGTRPSLYASVLLELADTGGRLPIPIAVLPMIQRSLLETRLMSILKRDRPGGGRRLTTVAVALMSLVALSVAAAAPQEEAPPKPPKPPVAASPEAASPEVASPEAKEPTEPALPPLPAIAPTLTLPPQAVVNPALAPMAEPMPMLSLSVEPMPALAPMVEPMVEPMPALAPSPAPQVSGTWTVPEPAPDAVAAPAVGGIWTVPAPATASAPLPEPPACTWNGDGSLSYSGSMSMTSDGGYRMVEGVGMADGNLMMKKVVDGVILCLKTRGDVEFTEDMTGIHRIGEDGIVLLATVEDGRSHAMEITGMAPADHVWSVDDQPSPFDEGARAWRDSLLEVLGGYWEISTIRGELSSLRGEISSMRGHLSSLRGEASSVRGEASSVRGEISGLRGERSALQGEISSVRGEISGLQGEISSHEGEISSLNASRSQAGASELESIEAGIGEHQQAIETLERQIEEFGAQVRIQEYEQQIEQLEVEARVAALELEAQELQTGARMQEIEAEIEAYEVQADRQIEEIQVLIEELDVEERIAAIRTELEFSMQSLHRALEAIR